MRNKHTKETKLKVVLAALAGDKPISQIAQEHSVHPAQIKEWKSQALEAMAERFARSGTRAEESRREARGGAVRADREVENGSGFFVRAPESGPSAARNALA